MGRNVIRMDPKTGRNREYFQGDDGKLYNDQSHYQSDQRTNYLIDQFSDPASNSMGKPGDYGLVQGGGSMRQAKTPIYNTRMAGGNIATAVVSELAPQAVEPLRQLLQPAFNAGVRTIFRTDAQAPQVARIDAYK